MGSFCTSTPATTTQNQSQTYTANPQITAAGTQALNMAEGAASQPFSAPAAPVADFNPFQTQAFGQIQGMQGGLNPYIANANASQAAAGTPLTQGDISQYLNPYADQALADMKKYVFDPQRRNTMGNAVQSAGGVGAERLALTSQNLDKTQADAVSQADAGFYSNAANIAQQQKQMAANSAQGWLGLGLGAQSGNLQATGALAGAGNQQQALSQAQLNSPYYQTLARLAYPFQTSQFLAGISGGLAPAFGGTTTGTGTGTSTPAQPSPFNQIAGLGLAGAGVAGSLGWNPFGGSGTNATLGDITSLGSGSGPIASPFAEGGEVDGEDSNPFGHVVDPILSGREASSIVPNIPLQVGSGQNTGAHLNLSPPQQAGGSGGSSGGMGDVVKMAATVLPFLLARGGSVNPWEGGQGYDNGGDVEEVSPDQFNRFDAASSDPEPSPWQPSVGTPGDTGTMPLPGAYTRPPPPMIPPPPQPRPSIAAPLPGGGDPTPMPPAARPAPQAYNPDMKLQDFMMPKDQNPYPDALNRDAGQQITRSPWAALISAGAKIAQSTQRPGAALASGVEAGMGTLSKQRTELRSEQQINQKADELYRHAKSELNKYTRLTPGQIESNAESKRYHDILAGLGERKVGLGDRRIDVQESLGRERINAQMKAGNLVYAGPVKGEDGMGYFYDRKHLDENGQPAIFKMPFDVGAKPGVGGRESARQWAYQTYKSLYPDDAEGAADILKGHRSIGASDVRKSADAYAAKAIAGQNIQPQNTDEWLEEHKRLSDLYFQKRMEEMKAAAVAAH